MPQKAELRLIEDENPTCRVCGSTEVTKAYKRLLGHELRQRYRCKKCGTFFTAGKNRHKKIDQEAYDFALEKVNQGYRGTDIPALVKKRFGYPVSYGWVQNLARRYAPGKLTHGNKRMVKPRTLMVAVRKLVPLEELAKEMGASPIIVDRLMKEIAFIGEPPSFLSLGWQVRRIRGLKKDLVRLTKVAAEVEEGLLTKSGGGKNTVTLKKNLRG